LKEVYFISLDGERDVPLSVSGDGFSSMLAPRNVARHSVVASGDH